MLIAAVALAQTFDVASIEPAQQPYVQMLPQRMGGRITWTTDLWRLIGFAYNLPMDRLRGDIPGDTPVFTIRATLAAAATDVRVR